MKLPRVRDILGEDDDDPHTTRNLDRARCGLCSVYACVYCMSVCIATCVRVYACVCGPAYAFFLCVGVCVSVCVCAGMRVHSCPRPPHLLVCVQHDGTSADVLI
jgi:hypothetical protein